MNVTCPLCRHPASGNAGVFECVNCGTVFQLHVSRSFPGVNFIEPEDAAKQLKKTLAEIMLDFTPIVEKLSTSLF